MPAFPDDAGKNLVPHDADIGTVEVEPFQAGIEIDAKPFAAEEYVGVGVVEFLQPFVDRPQAIAEQFLPSAVERLEIDRAVDFLDQIVLARKITIEQRLGHPQAARQRACATAK